MNVWKSALSESQQLLQNFISNPDQLARCEAFSQLLIDTYKKGGTVFTCGNGGSHCDAMHFAEEMTGRYRLDRRPFAALALGDASHLTCVGNDYGFKFVFSRQIEALAKPNDLLIGLSTSGNSENLLEAFTAAKSIPVKTVALLGRDGGRLKELADFSIVIPAQTSDRIQEMHIKILHIAIEATERALVPENYR